MKDWKIRQQYTHKLHDHADIQRENVHVLKREDIRDVDFVNSVLAYYFRDDESGHLYYPHKSYSVALIYAKLLEKHFGEDFYEALNDPDLLLGDKHFVPYNKDKETYDQLIDTLTAFHTWDFESNPISQVQATVRYFKKEFLLE